MMDERITAAVTDENGAEVTVEFRVERSFTAAGHAYLALIPAQEDDDVYLFDYRQTEAGVELLEIESDEEYERAAEAYEALLAQESKQSS